MSGFHALCYTDTVLGVGPEAWLHFLINTEEDVANMISRILGQVHIIITIMELRNYSAVVFMVLIPQ